MAGSNGLAPIVPNFRLMVGRLEKLLLLHPGLLANSLVTMLPESQKTSGISVPLPVLTAILCIGSRAQLYLYERKTLKKSRLICTLQVGLDSVDIVFI